MVSRDVELTDQMSRFLDEQVGTGRHLDASEVVREALRRYQADLAAEAERTAAIRAVITEGREAIAGGDYILVAGEEDADALLGRLTRRTAVG